MPVEYFIYHLDGDEHIDRCHCYAQNRVVRAVVPPPPPPSSSPRSNEMSPGAIVRATVEPSCLSGRQNVSPGRRGQGMRGVPLPCCRSQNTGRFGFNYECTISQSVSACCAGASPRNFGFIGTQTYLPQKFSFSSDFGHFNLKMLENAKNYAL